MNGYNATAIGEDRATRRSDPSTLMVAYSVYNYLGARKVDSGKKRQQIHTMTSCFLYFSACFFYVSKLYRVRQRRIASAHANFLP